MGCCAKNNKKNSISDSAIAALPVLSVLRSSTFERGGIVLEQLYCHTLLGGTDTEECHYAKGIVLYVLVATDCSETWRLLQDSTRQQANVKQVPY